ncbi:MAG TPA: MerR family transcriptional regulator [Thermomicrobiales bacterium]
MSEREDREQAGPGAARDAAGPLLSIGAFARRSWLSPKALRLYDRLGLLTPAYIDRDNGYRGYRESQLATARLIAMLRRLDMPLAQIAAVVAAPDPQGAAVIGDYWATVEQRIAAQRLLATHLQHSLHGTRGDFSMYEIHEREVAAQTVLTEQRHVQVGELSDFIGAAMMRLGRLAADHGGVTAAPFVIYHGEVNGDSDGPVEVCIPIDPSRTTQGAATRREPAHREAYTTITKAQVTFPQILSAYDAVVHWIEAQGKRGTGSPREVYFADFDAAGPNDAACDVAIPIA